ncbi:non-ribosomal peptide synthetase [Micromonospora peucetia]|uniref:Amino acid adenylation domain-containing protein n=1 Tax=Micromonospora peucetia TaxID=47871 RepID=A0A1C6VWL4_9ACTN|nr:non-ribosomal peptide synthetase [Micromonospora peucetia]SCL70738.1 amino acid adenylation domain-containing protein [Micromonospora peucetia]
MTSTANQPNLRESLIQRRLAGRAAGRRNVIPAVDRSGDLPLSFGQQQMWFLNRLDTTSPEYLVSSALRLRGPLDRAALTRAWDALIARHEILRTRYELADLTPVQVIDEPRPQELPLVDLAAVPQAEREERAAALLAELAATGFDLAAEWPVRATLLRLGPAEHLLVLVIHHIACDAPSTAVLLGDLAELYGAFVRDEPSPLTPPAVQFADFAAWQRDRLRGDLLERHLEHWRDRLAGIAPLELPADRPRPRVRDWRGASVPFALPADVSAALREIARGAETTLFVTLLTAFQALLSRYTGRTDIPVGSVTSVRDRAELRNLVGYGIDNMVVRGSWTGDPAFADLLRASRATVRDAFAHADVPFALLVDEFEPERDLSRTPLYQVAFTLGDDTPTGTWPAGLTAEPLWLPTQVAKVDLQLHVVEGADGQLRGHLEYATALFDPATVRRMADHLGRLLHHVAAHPDARISELRILDDAELAAVTPAPARPAAAVTRTVHGVFAATAAAHPGATAVVAGARRLTYAELDATANRLAHHLRALGAGPERLVAVCLDRGAELVCTLLGVLKSGSAYLPVEPGVPADRVDFMLADAGARIVVTTEAHRARFADFDGVLVVLDDPAHAGEIAGRPGTDPGVAVDPENLIYVIYTSGSTGRPKGVFLTHANVLRLMTVAQDDLKFGPADVWPLFHSYAFDVSVWELWGALLHGGRLVVVPREVTRSPGDLLDLLVEEQVTVLNQTPTAFRGLVGLARDGDPRIDRLALRAVIFAGEKLEYGDLGPWVARRGLAAPRLLNLYGITEITVHATYYEVGPDDLAGTAANPIGVPLADLSIHLLDPYGNPVPVGVTGEIHVGGPGVARGYLNRPELTAQRFVPDPFGPAGARLYRSGDLARRRADGSLEFVGRIDDQVKIRGYRVELGEIEAAISALPGVREAVVVVREDTPGDRRLVAYSVVDEQVELPRPGQVRAALARTLPEYMIPSAFVPLARLPLTVNGKLDKRALPAPDRTVTATDRPYLAPRTEVEERLAAIWAELLGLERIGVEDGFFDVGGDSIRAVALAGAIRAAGLDVQVRDLFERRSIAELAEFLTGRPAPADPEPAVAPFALIAEADRTTLPDGVVDAYPCTQVQLGMLAEMLAGEHNHYLNATTYRVPDRGEFSFDAFREAAALLVRRHEVLRTSFDLTGYSVPMQLVHATAEMRVGMDRARAEDRDGLERELRDFIAAERAEMFDLGQPALFRLHARVCADGSWWLTLTECHPIMDGWSYHSLMMELVGAYHRIRDGLAVEPRPAPPVRFADAVAAELRSTGDGSDRAFWHDRVAGRDRFVLPEGWGDPTAEEGAQYDHWVPLHDLEPGLRALARETGVPFKSVMLAAHLKVMSQLTGSQSFFSGLVSNIRPEVAGADRVYGMHLNTVPFVHDVDARTWRELIGRTFAGELELWPHRRYPLPVLQREVGDGGRMLDVRFSFHDFHQIDTDEIDYTDSIDDSPNEFPLGVISRLGFITLEANLRHLGVPQVARLGGMYRAVLEAMVADVDGDASVVCLPAGEVSVVLADGVSAVQPVSRSVLVEFEARVAETPSAEAVSVPGDRGVDFAELDSRAGQVARWLAARGVGAGAVVGVLLDRGVDLVASMLGVWKAGAAFVPVDPSYPPGRIAAMLADAGARVAVTSGRYADRFAPVGVEVVRVEEIGETDSPLPARATDLDELAYVIFTSGSTGRPKGVQVTHRGLANHVRWAAGELASRGAGGCAVFSSVAFDLQVPNLWAPLVAGQRVVMVGQDVDLAELGVVLAGAGPFSFLKLTPGHLEILGRQLSDEALASLASVVVVAGEALPAALANRWLTLLGPGGLVNEYGPTEASVGTCIFPIEGEQPGPVVPIGRALPGMTMYVLNRDLQLSPVGVVGELYVGGVGVARGYANQPGLTAERFVPDPFAGTGTAAGTGTGARLYRTGDLVRRMADGAVEFVGRVDHQVKIRGYRIELGEIESVVEGTDGVADAVALVGESDRLVVFYRPTAPGTELAERLRQRCAEQLPEYMIPAEFVAVEAIPLNANGKVDRAALWDTSVPTHRAYVAPATELETQLAGIWGQVLNLEQVSTQESFFDLGGHSISAIALVGALRGAGHAVSVRDVFVHRTVAALAAHLTAGDGVEAAPAFQAVAPFGLLDDADRAALPAGIADAYPCAQVQLAMLVVTLSDSDRRTYHNVSAFPIRDERAFDGDALRGAVQTVVARHEILRTSFDLTGYSVPMQLVHTEVPVDVTVLDLGDGTDEEAENQLRAYLAAERTRPFTPDQVPQMRVAGAAGRNDTWWFVLTMSHGILEGWSHHSLLMEILDNYRSLRDTGAPAAFEATPVRYADFVAGELEALSSTEDRDYWQGVVAQPIFELPAGWGEDESVPEYECGTQVPLHDLMDDLRELASRTDTSLKSVLLAAHLKVMSQLTAEPVFTSGLVSHGRPEVTGADRVYGMHLNTLPFVHDAGARTWRELIRGTFAGELELWPHRRYPLPAVQRLGDGRRPIEILFNYLDFEQVDTERVDFDDAIYEASGEFGLHVSTLGGVLNILARPHQVSYPNVLRLGGMYRVVLEAMVADVDGDASVVCLPAGEVSVVLADGVSAVQPVSRSVLVEFEARVAETPSAEAVSVPGGRGAGFAELDARAAAIGRRLVGRGVGAGAVVGVLLDRGVDLVASMLGVWKAGAAFVPVDPSYPPGRIAAMLADAGARVAVTSGRYADRFTGAGVDVLRVEDVEDDGDVRAALPGPADLDELAYVIFTSGSTGRPKGVQVTHRGLANHVRWAAGELASRGAGGCAVFSSVAFDLQVPNLWAPLVAGQRVVMVGQDVDLAELGVVLAGAGPFSFLKLTPGHLEILGRQLSDEALASLASVVVVAGEALPAALANRWLTLLGPGGLVNEYGPTEASVGTCIFPIEGEQPGPVVPIGRALPGMTMYVLNRDGELSPVGVVGELYVGGVGVARGYANQPGLTAERFVPDPFGAAGARLYRTGDLVRRMADGAVEFVGRVDHQVKIRGYRIELGEIESALEATEGVGDAVALVSGSAADGDARLVAFYRPTPPATPGLLDRIRSRCAEQLPEYMIPAEFVAVEAIPLNANGKVDRAALWDSAVPVERVHVAPATELETQLAGIWGQVLNLEQVSTDASFFDLGGDSLRAVALVGALRAAGLGVAVRDVFLHRTVAALAAHLSGKDAAPAAPAFQAVAPFSLLSAADRAALPAGLVDAYPAVQAQVGMTVEIQKDPDKSLYHIVRCFRVNSGRPFSADALRAAVRDVVGRHETLRTSFDFTSYSVPMQLVHAEAPLDVRVTELTGGDVEARLRAYVDTERARPFELDQPAPLLRVAAHRTDGHGWWLTVAVSHLVTGGWDLNTLLVELIGCYERRSAGMVPESPEPTAVRYADFVAAELTALKAGEDEAYWRGVVDGYASFTTPDGWGRTDGPRESLRTRVSYQDLEPKLRALASTLDVSPKSVLHAAHLKVMSQLTDQGRFYTGLVCDARPEVRGAERVHGMYINVLPFAYARGAGTWRELVRSVFDREVELWPHRRYPLPAVQRMAGAGSRPIDVVFDYTEFRRAGAVADESVDFEAIGGEGGTEFALQVTAAGGFLDLVGDSHLFGSAALARVGAMFRQVLTAMVADPDGDAVAVRLPEAERAEIEGWSAGDTAEVGGYVPAAFEAQAARRPDAVAITCDDIRVSYRDLNGRANRLAHHLRELGVGPEVLVGVCAHRSVEQVVAMLAVHKAGGVYLPLDPSYPAERLAFMLADAAAPVLLTTAELRGQLPAAEAVTVLLDGPDTWAGLPATDPAQLTGADSGCYVIYTSGSTGQPKGVVVPHRALVNRSAYAGRQINRLDEQAVLLQKTEIGFDVSPAEVYAALSAGARIVVARPGGHRDPAYLRDLIVREGVTAVELVPSMLSALLAEGIGGCRSLRSVAVGGEEIALDVARSFLAALPGCELHNTYGPAETTVDVTSWLCSTDALRGLSRVPLGTPFTNLTVRVLDEHLQPVPVGVRGELCIGGVGLARGYLGAPGLTAQRFVPDPYGAPGSRLYRTGDAAAWRADGTVDFLGRIDSQVKLHGVRIELGEIETALRACPGVTDAVAAIREQDGRRTLVGYLVTDGGPAPTPGELRERLLAELPEAMVPAAYVSIDAIPVDPHGKVDRRQLPAPDARSYARGRYERPNGPVESAMAGVWSWVLDLDRVSVTESFFDLGGDSMTAVTLVGSLRAAGHEVTVRDIFAHRTIRRLVTALAEADTAKEGAFRPVEPYALIGAADRAALPAGLVDAYPATQAQVGMAVEIQKDPGKSLYHIVQSIRVDDGRPFDADALQATVDALVARHETLRTSVDLTGYSVPMQLVRVSTVVPVAVHPAAGYAEHLAAERRTPFDLESDSPLLRVAAHVDGAGAWWLTLAVSHLVTGGWDLNALLAELLGGYGRRSRGEAPTQVEPPAVRYADHVAGELEALRSPETAEHWRAVVTGRPKLTLPDTFGDRSGAAAVCRYTVDVHDLDAAVRRLASDTGTSVKAVLHAAHLKVMSQLTNESAFYTGLVCDARPEVRGAERVHGMYINVLPFAHARSAGTWRELVRSVFDREVELWPHRRYPLPAVARMADAGSRPIDVVFGYVETRQDGGGAVEASDAVEVGGPGATEFGLSVGAGGGTVRLVSDSRTADPTALVRIGAMFREVLAAMVTDPGGDAAALRLPAGERADLARFTPGRTAEVGGYLPAAFEAQAARRPDAVAVTSEGVSFSYGQLNGRANRLAHHLRELGVGPEVLVGVCAHRSVEQVVAMLAVHKAGGVYLPLDPSYPAERLAFMLADAAAPVLLTTAELRAQLPPVEATVVLLDDPDAWAGQPPTDPEPLTDPDNGSVVIYTSGSTGRPKGSLMSHRALVNRTDHVGAQVYRLAADAVVLQKTEIGFDVSPAEVYAALSAGARIVVARPGGHRDPAYLRELMAREGVTTVHFVPSMLPALLAEGLAGCRSLRSVAVGGEEIALDVARAFLAALPGCELHNTYGPAEATVDVSSWRCTTEALAGLSRVPLGTPHPNLRLYVLDERLGLVPVGVPGELCIGGTGLARGYLGRPGLTAERFVPDPYGSPGSRLYRTGDAAAWRADGTVDFLGRLDSQVKLHGVRIELGEIETALRACPGVTDAVAAVREHDGRRTLVGYVLPATGDAPTPARLRERLLAELPEAMVPAAYVTVDAIPKDPNGKVDRRQLPAPDASSYATGAYQAPAGDVEAEIAAIWARVLGVAQVSVTDSFFDLGGDSMLAVTLVGTLRAAGHPTSVRDVFAHRTVRRLAAALADADAEVFRPVAPYALIGAADRARLPAGVVDAYPASRTQLGMLVESAVSGDRAVYHSVLAHQVRDGRPFDAEALRGAVRAVVARHEILRTSFDLVSYSVPMQLVHADVAPDVHVEDGRGIPAQRHAALFAEFVAAERARPFDVSTAPLLRVTAHVDGAESWWFTFTISHVVTEGWSSARLVTEVLNGYAALADGRAPSSADLPAVRYADFIAAEIAALESTTDREHWRSVWDGRAPFALPAGWGEADTPDATVDATVDFTDLDEALRALARDGDVSVKAVLHAAHLKVLSQLTGEPGFHAGLVCDARPEVLGADEVHGMYLNTVPFPYDRSARSWRDLVAAVFDREVELWPHRRFPLAEMQREAGHRLLHVLFNYQDFTRAAQGDGSAPVVTGAAGEGATEFDLSCFAQRGRYALSARAGLVSQANLDRIAGMYRAVLEAMVADPDGDCQAVCVPGGERDRLLGVTDTGADEPVTGSMVALFQAQLARDPRAVAVVAGGVELTYAQVDAAANRLAHHLRAAGVGRETVVGVCLDRDADLVPALLGVLKAGAAYLPLDPAQPAERISYMLADAGVRTVVTTCAQADPLADFDGLRVLLDAGDLDGHPETDPGIVRDPDDLVYVIYTSGSTGRPKGVCVSDANVLRLLDAAQEHYAVDETDVWALFHSYAFDVSVWELWGALLHGSRLVLVPREVARVPQDLLDLLVTQRVTMLAQTPTALRGLVRLAAEDAPGIRDLSLRAVVIAGEKLDFTELAPWATRLGLARVALVNMYGITETTVYSTYHRITRADLAPGVGSRIGRPLSGVRMYVLDQYGHPAPIGVPGEVYLAGHGVARGYLNQPELTATRFLPDPYGPPGSRMYRTGDLASRLPDGSVEFLGRLDDQVKVRGYRIEPGEIEAALTAVPGVEEAVVVLRADDPADPRLTAYLVTGDGHLPEVGPLRARLALGLPEYMIPAAFVVLDQLPRNNSGKLDRRALPAPTGGTPVSGRDLVGPAGPLEERVAGIWADVLGLPAVSVCDGFFDLGGHSITALVLASTMRAAGLDVTVADIFRHPTVRALCEVLASRDAPEPTERPVEPFELVAPADLPLLPDGLGDAYPLSRVQLGMLLEMLADNGQNHYHNVVSFLIPDGEPFDLVTLRAAVNEVVARHDVLRTSVDTTSYSVPMQLVHRTVDVPVRTSDLRGLAEADRVSLVRRLVGEEYNELFDVERAPLLRFTVCLETDRSWRLVLTICHVIIEGWSLHALVMEILDRYHARRAGAGPDATTTPPGVRFADFVAGELSALASADDQRYWQDVVERHPRFLLPAGWTPSAPATREPYTEVVSYADLEPRLRALASAARVSLKAVLHAAHLKVLSQLTDEPVFYSGLVCNTRPDVVGSERVYAMSLNTLPFPHDRRATSWRELVQRVHAREADLWPHRRYPAPAIRTPGRGARLTDVYFSYLDFTQVDGGRTAPVQRIGASTSEFALAVAAGAGRLELSTDSHAMGRADAARLAGMYRLVLEAMVADPDGDPREAYLPAGERDDMLVGWNYSATPGCVDLVPARVAARAAATPDAEAVDGTTYAELDAAANRIGHHLRGAGVGPERVVGVLLERGVDLVAALLGVWRAGGAYLPIDPAHPAERVAAMLADAGATVVVTSAGYADRFAGVELVLLDRDADKIAGLPVDPPAGRPDPDHLAYVIFTSGSTGRPNGVQISHRSLANYLGWAAEELVGDRTGGAALFSSVAYDMVVTSIWAPLVTGQRLWLLPPDADLDELGPRLADAGPFSFVKLTPGHLDLLTSQLGAEQAAALTPLLVLGGEALTRQVCDRWHALAPGSVLLNEYGPTEATVAVSRYPVTGPLPGDVAPIGRPLGGMRTYVLDADLRPVPVGVVGHVHLGGPGLARGYAGRPALTADRFVPDPFDADGGRLYRTGDLGRWLPDGQLDLLGRVDDQVKIRGHRVEPGEVRAVLVAHPAVRDAVVTVESTGPGGPRLVAYHVGDAPDLAEHCARWLPSQLVPSVFIPVPAIPLNANGKVDRGALPPVDLAGAAGHTPPRPGPEQLIADIWAGVLEIDRVGRHDRFFALGGHSLLVVPVVTAARQAGVPLTLRAAMLDRTLAELAASLTPADPAASVDPPTPADPAVRSGAARTAAVLPPIEPMLAAHRVPGASLALLRDGELVEVRAAGHCTAGGGAPVTPATIFQVGSVSKLVTAVGALALVRRGQLQLDADVNAYLKGWQLPTDRPVSLRQLLCHVAGLTPTGSTGHPRGGPVPTLSDLLHGRGVPTAPIRAQDGPDPVAVERNSHFVVVQQLMEDATATPFAALMAELVFEPLGMTGSSFDQGFPETSGRPVAVGHDERGESLPGGWEVRADPAAAGLWTTATDLAQLTREIHTAYQGRSALLNQELAVAQLTAGPGGTFGLGCMVDRIEGPAGARVEFTHRGRTTGYRALTAGRVPDGSGLVLLTNGDAGYEVMSRLASDTGLTEEM